MRHALLILGWMPMLLLPAAHLQADQRCATLITTRCEQCHYKTRICQVLGSRGKWGWSRTVKRMQKLGAKITDEEAKHLAACLAAAPKGAPHVCQDNESRGTK
ncbi:MAG: hypothetical protein AB1413_07110 [Thermodesulfobacteriota bacterium]